MYLYLSCAFITGPILSISLTFYLYIYALLLNTCTELAVQTGPSLSNMEVPCVRIAE